MILDILVRIRIRGSGPVINRSGSTPDPTPFFSEFKDAKKFSFYLHAGTFSSVLKLYFLLKFCVKILFCKHYFRKGRDPEPDSYPYLRILEAQKPADPDP
jgi:hypothetical protein